MSESDPAAAAASATTAPATFEREFSLDELLPGKDRQRLGQALDALLDGQAAFVACDGELLWGERPAQAQARVAVALEIEPLGWLLSAERSPERLKAAAVLLRQLLVARSRYLMAADLHLDAMRADFAALRQERDALAASEARYRALSEQLELRVKEQVDIIDARQRQLYQVEKLASVGQLAAGVAHEINNPVGFVRSNLSTLKTYLSRLARLRELPAQPELTALWQAQDLDFVLEDASELIDDCVGGLDRVTRIVSDLKGFSSVDQPEETVVDLNDNLKKLASIIGGQKKAGIRLELDLHALPPVLCLPGHINQVLLNLLTNAMQAVEGMGKEGDASGGRIVLRSQASADGEGVEIRICDNGCGIAAEDLPRVFDPFFTRRPVGQGTGLGLTVARDIITAHSGSITISSPCRWPDAGEAGTEVLLTLPRA